jgi:hypothetical protein
MRTPNLPICGTLVAGHTTESRALDPDGLLERHDSLLAIGSILIFLQLSRCPNTSSTLRISSLSPRTSAFSGVSTPLYPTNVAFSTMIGDIKVENKIGDAIVERAIRAHREKTPWRCCIMIPLLPGFTFPVDHSDASAVSSPAFPFKLANLSSATDSDHSGVSE